MLNNTPMKKLTAILLFTSLFGYAQIDYKGLVKNLEEITAETDLTAYFNDLPIDDEYSNIEFKDERFLRFHGIIIDDVEFKTGWSGERSLVITLFDEQEDYEKIKTKLTKLYGEPEIDEKNNSIDYDWKNEQEEIELTVKIENGVFTEFDYFAITFNKQ